MVVAVLPMRFVQMAADHVVLVIPVRHHFMAAAGRVRMGMLRRIPTLLSAVRQRRFPGVTCPARS